MLGLIWPVLTSIWHQSFLRTRSWWWVVVHKLLPFFLSFCSFPFWLEIVVFSFKIRIFLQGPRSQIDAFQTNIFSWINDILIKNQWFLGFWDREIWYETFIFYFINLRWPPQPQKEKVSRILREVGVAPSMIVPRPCTSSS